MANNYYIAYVNEVLMDEAIELSLAKKGVTEFICSRVSEEVLPLVNFDIDTLWTLSREERNSLKRQCEAVIYGRDYTDLEKSVADTLYGNILWEEEYADEAYLFRLAQEKDSPDFDWDYYSDIYKDVYGCRPR